MRRYTQRRKERQSDEALRAFLANPAVLQDFVRVVNKALNEYLPAVQAWLDEIKQRQTESDACNV